MEAQSQAVPDQIPFTEAAPPWRVLWTRSNCEQLVHDQLMARGFVPFFPRLAHWIRRRGLRARVQVPMFPGYLFLRHALDKEAYVEVSKARGLVGILGTRWDRPASVSAGEIDAIHQLVRSELPALPHPYLREGCRVRIRSGPLAGVEGLLLESDTTRGILLLSIEFLRRSVAVEVDCTLVAPA